MFDVDAGASRWPIRVIKFTVAAAAIMLLAWWASQVFGWRFSKSKSTIEQVAILRNRAERPFVRRVAAEALERSEAPIASELAAELSEGDPIGRELAAFALARLDVQPVDAVDELIAALDDSELGVRRQAAIALGRIGVRPSEVAAALAQRLRGVGWEIRGEIMTALRRVGPEGITILHSLLLDADADVRRRAVIELGRTKGGDSAILDALRSCLCDSDPCVRAEAYAALGRRSAISIDELIGALHDADSIVQSTACTLLGRAGSEAEPAIADLAALLANRDPTAENAIWALTQIGNDDPELVAPLAPLMDSDDERTAENAVRVLAGFGRVHQEIYARLLEHVDDPRRGIGRLALNALHNTGLESRLRPPELIAALAAAEADVQSLILWNANAEPPGRGPRRVRRDRFMRGYGIDGLELARLTGLGKLRLLDVRENPVDDASLQYIASFERLERLTLDRTLVTSAGLAHLAGLTRLRSLSLAGCEIDDAGLEQLKNLSSLEFLNLDDTQVTDAGIEHLAALKGLKRLGLRGTSVTDAGLVHLKELPALEDVASDRAQFTLRGLAQLDRLTNLRPAPDSVVDDDLALLVRLPRLRTLSLSQSGVTDAGLAHIAKLTQLESLQLDGTAITDAGLTELRTLAKLKTLTVARTDTTEQGFEMLQEALSGLEPRFAPDRGRRPDGRNRYEVDGLETWEAPDAAPSDWRVASQKVGE